MEKYATKKVYSARFMNTEVLNHLQTFWKGQDFISWMVYEGEPVSDYLLKNGGEKGEVVLLTIF